MMIEAPKDETLWVQMIRNGVVAYAITSNTLRTEYYLYKVDKDKLKKTRYKNADPRELERKIK